MLDTQVVADEEERLRRQVRELDDPKRAQFHTQFARQVRDPDTYAVLNYLFISGLHHFYLGRWARGALNLALFLVAVMLMFSNMLWLGIGLILAISIAELYALFRSQLVVQDHNNQLMQKLLDEIAQQGPNE